MQSRDRQAESKGSKQAADRTSDSPADAKAPAGLTAAEMAELVNRPAAVDRRSGLDRRNVPASEGGYTGPERRAAEGAGETGLERRRGPGVRRPDDRRSAEEGEMTGEQFEFVLAVETYKKVNRRMYPTWTEVLEVIYQLGYRKVKAREIQLDNLPEPKLWTGDVVQEATPEDDEDKKAA